jgi:2,4-dienoyl-CoA reductase-like NADH-dependent reductase (Old Yellow Enzyme family)
MSTLFTSLKIRDVELPNRLLRSATWEGMAEDNGRVTDRLLDLYRDLAKGGVGLVITGYMYISPEGKGLPRQIGIHDDEYVAGLAQLADIVHEHGGRVIVQVVHAGGQTNKGISGHDDVVAPSAVPYRSHGVTPRALTTGEVEALVEAHARAVTRAVRAGFDGVQIHAAHGYLVNRFLSPVYNLRDDRYGGDPEARAQFGVEVIRVAREAIGPGRILSVKLNSDDFEDGGLDIEGAVVAARLFAAAGADHIEVSGGTPMSGGRGAVRSGIEHPEDEAYFKANAARIKHEVGDVPVGVVGGVRSFEVAEELIASGAVDTVSLCRPLISEPDLPRRWASGDRAKARCTSDSKCFGLGIKKGIRCAVYQR